MSESNSKIIRRDVRRKYLLPIIVRVFSDFLAIALPSVAAMLIGTMSDSLLALDREAIMAQLPRFGTAMLLDVLLTPLLQMEENVLLTKIGFGYDVFLVNRFFEKRLIDIENSDSGAVMERLEIDSAAFAFDQIWLFTRPVILAGYVAVIVYMVLSEGYHLVYCGILAALSGLRLLLTILREKQKQTLKRKTLEYEEKRRAMQQELGSIRDFVAGFSLNDFEIARFSELFRSYRRTDGQEKIGFEAVDTLLDFLCGYGVQFISVLLGAILVARGSLSVGGILGGYLMLSSFAAAWNYAAEFFSALKEEPEKVKRMSIFYGASEARGSDSGDVSESILVRNVNFRYPANERDAVHDISLRFSACKNYTLTGPNGSGKSTLLYLLSGLYEPDNGQIADSGGNVLNQLCLRRSVTLLEQDGAIFSGTVASNLFSEEMDRAKCILDALGFGKELQYNIEPEGKNLSPGERKKILIARALLRDTLFLALDEPLNHLDKEGQAALEAMIEGRQGLIIVSHRSFGTMGSAQSIAL